RNQRVITAAANGRQADVDRARRLIVGLREVETNPLAALLDADVKAHALLRGRIELDERLALAAAVGPSPDRRSRALLGDVVLAPEAVQDAVAAVARDQLGDTPLAQAGAADLTAQIAQDELGRPAVRPEDRLDVALDRVAAHVAHRRVLNAFLKELARVRVARPRNDAAEVALVRDAPAKRDDAPIVHHRRHDGHVHRMQ